MLHIYNKLYAISYKMLTFPDVIFRRISVKVISDDSIQKLGLTTWCRPLCVGNGNKAVPDIRDGINILFPNSFDQEVGV